MKGVEDIKRGLEEKIEQLIKLKERLSELEMEEKSILEEIRKLGEFRGSIQVKWVYCGKGCSKCPHGPYYYLVYRENNKVVWKYIGKVLDAKEYEQNKRFKLLSDKLRKIKKEKDRLVKMIERTIR